MKKIILVLVLALAGSSAAFADWQCHAVNSLGVPFYGVAFSRYEAASLALEECQINTPYGAFCRPTPYCEIL